MTPLPFSASVSEVKEDCFSWKRLLRGALFFLLIPGALVAASSDRVLSAEELMAMDRENAMWRLVRVEDSVETNLSHLRSAGYALPEVSVIESQLETIWGVAAERNFGWLHEDTVAEIKEVDREFISRTRAARLHRATGIRAAGSTVQSEATVNRLWRQALLRVLDYDEIGEFHLMNSLSARELNRLLKDLPLSVDEQRTLFQWQREFDGTLQSSAPVPRKNWQQQAQLDHWDRVGELLGEDRFVVYLERANSDFSEMKQVLAGIDGITTREILAVWRLRRKLEMDRSLQIRPRLADEMTVNARDHVAEVLGAARFSQYASQENARWMFRMRFVSKPRSTPPAGFAR